PRRKKDFRICTERPRLHHRAPSAYAPRPRTYLRTDRGQHLPRRSAPRTALLYASRARMGAVPYPHRRSLLMWGRHAPRRRRDRSPRTQRRAPGLARLEKRPIQGGRRMSTNGTSANAMPSTADIVILGAGVMGASIAFQLAQRKAGCVVII